VEAEGSFKMDRAEVKEARSSVQDSMPALSPLLSTTSNIQSLASGFGSYSRPPPLNRIQRNPPSVRLRVAPVIDAYPPKQRVNVPGAGCTPRRT